MIKGPLAAYLQGFLISGGGVIRKQKGEPLFYVQSTDKRLMQVIAWDARKQFHERVAWEEDSHEGWDPLYRLILRAGALPVDVSSFTRRPDAATPWILPRTDLPFFVRAIFEGKGGNLSTVRKEIHVKEKQDPVKTRTLTVVYNHPSRAVTTGLKKLLYDLKIYPQEGMRDGSSIYYLRMEKEQALRFLRHLYQGTTQYYSGAKMHSYRLLEKDKPVFQRIPGRRIVSTVRVK